MITRTRLVGFLRRLGHVDSHVRQIVALVIAVVTFVLFLRHGRSPITHFIAIWDIYAIVVLAMAWITICTANPRTIQRRARLQDSSRTLIFGFVIVAACMSLLAVILVLREHKELQKTGGLHLFMAVLAVLESWLLIHTIFTLRYAHIFYRSEREADVEGIGGGLSFPGGLNPDYQDFAYFSFIIGMTCQVSDVSITSRAIRRLALLHGLLSFAFNTAILALSINVISGLFVS
ncbi:MAG TPA: DUF1345 domain-containing protein [Terrimicrobiaceae bacterium]|nr:DUF1345 domain-containing protein [Terrimicrobiaceae bacterium]